MRAKEYIEIHKHALEFPEQLKAILSYSANLRTDLPKTIKFYDCYLSTFENLQKFFTHYCVPEIKKESYWRLLREELQSALKGDKSYSYLYKCILREDDILNNHIPSEEIKDYIFRQFEDYPKQFIDDYITTETNKSYYDNICDIFFNSDDILNIFNTAYEIFDNIRVLMYKPIQASFYCKDYHYKSEKHKYFILPLVASYLKNYDYDLTEEQLKNKLKVSEALSKYIAQSIDPQNEIVKTKSYWYFFQNTLKITVTDKEKLALLITEQTKFNQLPENEKQVYGTDFGKNCQLEIDKIRQLQLINNVDSENYSDKENDTVIPIKVRSVVILEMLRTMQCGKANNDLTKICKLISFITGNSYDRLYNEMQKGISFSKNHIKHIDEANKILSELKTSISIEKDKQY